jgi:hypothetical protein
MTSLTEAYQGNAREATSLRRLYAGAALVLLGAALSILAVVVPTTEFFTARVANATAWEMADRYAAVRVSGVLAGVGVPTALLGVFIVFPAGRRVRAAGAIGASLCLLGVMLFWGAYPHHWRGYGAAPTTGAATARPPPLARLRRGSDPRGVVDLPARAVRRRLVSVRRRRELQDS